MRRDRYKDYYHLLEKSGAGDPTGREVFRCMDCGSVTRPKNGWSGEPDTAKCRHGCSAVPGDWVNGKFADAYRENFERIFPDAPGSGL